MATPPDPDAEGLLAALAGVLSAHVVRGASGRILEIHILSSAEYHPKQVVRNVESALRAGLGLDIDRRVISVAQVRTPRQEPAAGNGQLASLQADSRTTAAVAGGAANPAGSGRLEFVRYQSRRHEDRCTCDVVLRSDDREVVGTGSGANTADGRAEAAARAVLDGINRVRPEFRFQLDGTAITSSRGRSFVIVAAQLVRGREALRLAGAAPLARSPEEGAILAALQATNRWSG
jgi:hypothetical protein